MAQYNVPPCPVPGSSYFNAPLLDCCLDGYHFATLPGYGNEVPPAFCNQVESGQWLAFQTGKGEIEFTFGLTVQNCGNGQGVEAQVFGIGNDCSLGALFPVSTCETVSTTGSFTATNLVPGHVYYVFLDGSAGDICEYTLTVENVLDTCVAPQPYLTGPTTVNAGQTAIYTLITPSDTCFFEAHNPCNNEKQDTVTCPGTCIGTGTADTVWTGPPGATIVPIPGTLSAEVTFGTQSGIVRVEVTGPCGNYSGELFVTVCNVPPPTLFYNQPVVVNCLPSELFTLQNYAAYQWSNGQTASSITAFIPGPYSVTVTDANGCTATDSIFVPGVSPPSVTISGPTAICPADVATLSTTVTGQPPFTYAWSNNAQASAIMTSTAGNYTVSVTDQFGCGATDNHLLNVYPIVPPTNLPPLALCQDALPYDFFGTDVTTSGTYSVTFTNWQGCDSMVIQDIEVSPAVSPTVTSSVGNILPPGGTADLLATPGFATYVWSDGQTGQVITVDTAGTYTVTVTNSFGCTGTAVFTLENGTTNPLLNYPVPPADSCSAAPPFCANYLNGYASRNIGYTLDAPGNLASVAPCTFENNQWLSFTTCDSAAQFVFQVENCQAATGLEFFVLQSADCQFFSVQNACFSLQEGSTDTLFLNNLAVGGSYFLMVDGINGDVCDWKILSATGVSDGAVYQEDNTPGQVQGPDGICAGGTASFSFTSPICDLNPVGGCPPASQMFCTPHLDTCISVQYDTIWHVSPAGAVFVNNDSIGATVDLVFPDSLPVPADGFLEFTVSVEFVPVQTDTFPCWNDCVSECLEIIPDTEPCAVLPWTIKVCKPDVHEHFFVICIGEVVDFMGQVFTAPGTYTINHEDQCGCMDLDIVNVEWYVDPPLIVSPPTYACSQDGATYTVAFNVFGLNSSVDGQPLAGPTFTSGPIPSGQPYSFLVQDFGNCQFFEQVVAGTHTCPTCQGETFDLGTILLCPGECFTDLGTAFCNAGSYQALVTNPATGCDDTYLFVIQQVVEQPLTVGPAMELCDPANLNYTVGFSIMGGTPPFQVNGTVVNGNFYQSSPIQSGSTYAFTVTDAAICNPQPITVGGQFDCGCLSQPGTVDLAPANACEGQLVSASFNNDAVVGTADALVFILHDGSGSTLGQVVGANSTGVFGFDPGTMSYGVTYYISPAVGPDLGGSVDVNSACFSISAGQPVTFYPMPALELLPAEQLTCALTQVMLNALASGGSGNLELAWDGPSNFQSSLPNPMASESGNYVCTATDMLTGCQATASTDVTEDTTAPALSVSGGELTCTETTVVLMATSSTPGLDFTWTLPSGDTLSGATISSNMPGSYVVVAAGANGCEGSGSAIVTGSSNAVIEADVEAIPPTCHGGSDGSIEVSNVSGGEAPYTTTLNNLVFVDVVDSLSAGTYLLVITDANGCTTESAIELIDPQVVTVSLGDDQTVAFGQTVTLSFQSSIVPDSIIWTTPDGKTFENTNTLEITPTESGRYDIVISDVNSCRSFDDIFINVSGSDQFFIPNVFSPNGDNANDVFMVYAGPGVVNVVTFKIFDRWGGIVFEDAGFLPNDPSHGWDGRLKEKALDPAVFVYMAEVQLESGETKMVSGDVLLLR